MPNGPATHGVLVTYRRPDVLLDHLRLLAEQTRPLTTLTVIDNDGDSDVKALVEGVRGQAAASDTVSYVGAPGNPGPAGGFSIGIDEVLHNNPADTDLIVLLDDNDPPRTNDVFAHTVAVFEDLQTSHTNVGGVGCWGAVLGPRGRLRMATDHSPVPVDYLAGGACPHYAVAALRAAGGGPDPDLFFGFEELDLGRAIHRAGFQIWSSGLARQHGWGEKMIRTSASTTVTDPTWRRYYSVRNLIAVLRKDGRTLDAAFVSIAVGLAKPLLNLIRRPRSAGATLALTVPAVVHAWTGRLGRRVEPI